MFGQLDENMMLAWRDRSVRAMKNYSWSLQAPAFFDTARIREDYIRAEKFVTLWSD